MANVVEVLSISSSLIAPRAFLCSSSSSPCLSRCKKNLAFTSSSPKAMRIQGAASVFLRINVKSSLGMRKIVCEASQDSKVQDVNDQSFKSMVLESLVPVLVDFWAPWCGPCRMIEPLINELAKQHSGKIKCVKVNSDERPGIATEYGIHSIPPVMIFKDGEKKDTVIGAVAKTGQKCLLFKSHEN